MEKYNRENTYEGFSLVEMLITITILGFVMLLTATVLTTLIKVSTASEFKTTTRNDVNFALELTKRALSNTQLDDIYIYDSSNVRHYEKGVGFADGLVTEVDNAYASSLGDNMVGNEVHVRAYGYNRWTCIGYFLDPSEEVGYILKTSVVDLVNHKDCFGSLTDHNTLLLTSEIVDVNQFDIKKILLNSGNTMFTVDMSAEPTSWPVGSGMPVSKTVSKQVTVLTQGLTWY